MPHWIEILKPGTFTAKNGESVTITSRDIDNIVAANPASDRESPLVFGHPEDNQPAFGWLTAVKRQGDIAMAAFTKVPEVVKQLVKDGYYRKVSVALMPDKKTIRHVGLLGAVQPAVPGLADVKLADGDEPLIFEFTMGEPQDEPGDDPDGKTKKTKEGDMPTVEELEAKLATEKAAREAAEGKLKTAEEENEAARKELSDGKAAAARAAIETKVNELVGKKILARDKPLVEKVALALGEAGEIELSEGGGKKPLQAHLFDFLSGLPDLGLTVEFSDPGKTGGKTLDTTNLTSCV